MNNPPNFPKFTLFASSIILLIAGIGLLGFGFFHLVLSDLSTLYPPKVYIGWTAEVYDKNTDFVVLRAKVPDDMPVHMRHNCENLQTTQYESVPISNLKVREVPGRWDEGLGSKWTDINDLDLPSDVLLVGYSFVDGYHMQRYARYCYHIAAADTNAQLPLKIIQSHPNKGAMVQSIGLTIASFFSLIGGGLLLFLALRLRALGRQWPVLQLASQL